MSGFAIVTGCQCAMNNMPSSSLDSTVAVGAQVGEAEAVRMTASSGADAEVDGDAGEKFKPMSAEEAAQWRQRQRPLSVYQPLVWQLVFGGLAVVVAWVWFLGRPAIAMSTLYGAAAVWVPAWVFVRALKRQQGTRHSMQALASLMFWEGVKIVLTIALLLAAPKVVKDLSWLALLLGFVVTVKAAWLGWWWQMRPQTKAQDY